MQRPETRKVPFSLLSWLSKAAPYIVSVLSLMIAFYSLNQAKIANALSIEPYITIQPFEGRSSNNLMNFIMKNEGKVGVNKLNLSWVSLAESSPGMRGNTYIINTIPITFEILKKNESLSFNIDIVSDIVQPKKEELNTPNGILYIESGKMHLLGIKAVYRRASDLRRFECTYYFVIQKKDSFNIIIDDLTKEKYLGIFADEIDRIDSKFSF
jgi:hypothetical protein